LIEHGQPDHIYLTLLGKPGKRRRVPAQHALMADDGDVDLVVPAKRPARAQLQAIADDFLGDEVDDALVDDVVEHEAVEELEADQRLVDDAAEAEELRVAAAELAVAAAERAAAHQQKYEERVNRPSSLNHVWGVFRFTLAKDTDKNARDPTAPVKFAWQITCPFHRRNQASGCKKRMGIPATIQDWEESSQQVLWSLQYWGLKALNHTTQSDHMSCEPCIGDHPPVEVMEAQKLTRKPSVAVPTDADMLIGEAEPLTAEQMYPPAADEAASLVVAADAVEDGDANGDASSSSSSSSSDSDSGDSPSELAADNSDDAP
jgi:hypothetical protein